MRKKYEEEAALIDFSVHPVPILFTSPWDSEQKLQLRLKNTDESHYGWYCVSAAPNSLFVRPRRGILGPGQALKVDVVLAASKVLEFHRKHVWVEH